MFIINLCFIHLPKLLKLYFFIFILLFFTNKQLQENVYLMVPNMKLLQWETICSMLKDVLNGKEKVDSVNLHKSR